MHIALQVHFYVFIIGKEEFSNASSLHLRLELCTFCMLRSYTDTRN